MNPDPTITLSWDYLVELSDDAQQPGEQEAAVIFFPPMPLSVDTSPAPPTAPEQGRQT